MSRYSGTPKHRLAGPRSDEREEPAPIHLAGGDGIASGRGPCDLEGHRMKPLSANGLVSSRISGRLADRGVPRPVNVVVRSSSLLFFLVNVLLGLPIRRRL